MASNFSRGLFPVLASPTTVVSNSATALTVGANGSTNPALIVDASTASSATGVAIKSAATGGVTTITATDSGANTGLTLASKGAGSVNLNTGSGNVTLQVSGVSRFTIGNGGSTIAIAPTSYASNSTTKVLFTMAADTTINASTESHNFYINGTVTRQHATGALALQRDVRITGSTDSFVAASTLTDAATLGIGFKSAGTNATVTNSSALYIPTQAITGTVTNSYALNITSATGATNNYAAKISGCINFGTRVVTAAGAVTVTATDFYVEINKTSGAATTVNLPASPVTGQTFIIKDGKGDAATNNITVTPAAGNIDGTGTKVINSNYGSVTIVYNGTEWNIIT